MCLSCLRRCQFYLETAKYRVLHLIVLCSIYKWYSMPKDWSACSAAGFVDKSGKQSRCSLSESLLFLLPKVKLSNYSLGFDLFCVTIAV